MLTTAARHEYIGDITAGTKNQPYNMPNQGGLLPNEYYLYGLRIRVRLRMTNPAAPNAPTLQLADAPYGLIDRLIVKGYHRLRQSQEEVINLRGSDLRELGYVYTTGDLQVTPNTLAAGNEGRVTPNLSLAADATNDVDFVVDVPFVPMQMPLSEQINWLLDAPNYDNLQLQINWSDENNVFSGQGAAIAFTAYGSATGSPTISVTRLFSMDTDMFRGFVPGRLWRYFIETRSGVIVSGGAQQRLFDIPRGNRIRSLMFKTGTLNTGVSSGNTAFATLSNTILASMYAYRGTNKLFRRYNLYRDIQQEVVSAYGIGRGYTPGYALMDFAKHGNLQEVFDATGLIIGDTGNIDCFIQADITGAANQAAVMVIEELRGKPVVAVQS